MEETIEFEAKARAVSDGSCVFKDIRLEDILIAPSAIDAVLGSADYQRYRIIMTPVVPDLQPCPFCGSAAELEADGNYPLVVCTGCGLRTRCGDANRAVADWNRRA